MRSTGRASLARRSTRSTRNDLAAPPSCPTMIRSPERSSPSRKNTAGPERESTCPTITAGPASPGRGPSSYQPARSTSGTSIVRSGCSPTGTTRASTPAAGPFPARSRPGSRAPPRPPAGRRGAGTRPGPCSRQAGPRPTGPASATPGRGCGPGRSAPPWSGSWGGSRSPGAPGLGVVPAGDHDDQQGEHEGGGDQGQAGDQVGTGGGAAEPGVDALRGRDGVVDRRVGVRVGVGVLGRVDQVARTVVGGVGSCGGLRRAGGVGAVGVPIVGVVGRGRGKGRLGVMGRVGDVL